jgi:hypothetical protein
LWFDRRRSVRRKVSGLRLRSSEASRLQETPTWPFTPTGQLHISIRAFFFDRPLQVVFAHSERLRYSFVHFGVVAFAFAPVHDFRHTIVCLIHLINHMYYCASSWLKTCHRGLGRHSLHRTLGQATTCALLGARSWHTIVVQLWTLHVADFPVHDFRHMHICMYHTYHLCHKCVRLHPGRDRHTYILGRVVGAGTGAFSPRCTISAHALARDHGPGLGF